MLQDSNSGVSVGQTRLRRDALQIAKAGLGALDPFAAMSALLTLSEGELRIGEQVKVRLDRPIHVIGGGKATIGIVQNLLATLGDHIVGGVVAVNGEQDGLGPISVFSSTHPIPSLHSVQAGEAMLEYAESIDDDIVIAVFTGGSSAMVAAPPRGVSLEDKILLTEILLASGVDVVDVNTVRKHVSRVKGGRLVQRMPESTVINLTVSDVAGDVLDAITDPTTQDGTTTEDAVAILEGLDLWSQVPDSIREHLLSDEAQSPSLDGQNIQTVLVSSGWDACQAMQAAATNLGYEPMVLSTSWSGDASSTGKFLASLGLGARRLGVPATGPCAFIGCGGESTVRLAHWNGVKPEGGPNQELALAAALHLRGEPDIALLSLDTDGSDGGTDWAGALVDGETLNRSGLSRQESLRHLTDHQSTAALLRSGDLLSTGSTGTNVNDMFLVLVG